MQYHLYPLLKVKILVFYRMLILFLAKGNKNHLILNEDRKNIHCIMVFLYTWDKNILIDLYDDYNKNCTFVYYCSIFQFLFYPYNDYEDYKSYNLIFHMFY